MVRVVLIYGPTSPRLRADLSSLTGRLVSVRVVRGPSCLVPVIDNAGYICYAEARFLGHQNDATNRCKWTTTFPGRLHTFGRSDLSKSTPNSYANYNTTNKQKIRTHAGPFNIYQIIGPLHWHTGHILFFLVYARRASRISKMFFSKFLLNWTHTFFSHKQLVFCWFFLLCSTVQLTGP